MGDSASDAPKARPRFGWPLRIFLALLVFDIVFHSLAAIFPYRDWLERKELRRFPKRLPTWARGRRCW